MSRASIFQILLVSMALSVFQACEKDPVRPSEQPVLSATPTTIDLGKSSDTGSFQISNAGIGTLKWSCSASESWVRCSPAEGQDAATVTVHVDRDGLAPASQSYQGTIGVKSNGGSASIVISVKIDPPQPPDCLSVSKSSTSSVSLSWCAVSGADKYYIYRSQSASASPTKIATVSGTSYTDSNVDQARWYWYAVSAVKSGVEGAKCNPVNGYRRGWRFTDVSLYDRSDGIGFNYGLLAYGFNGQPSALVIFAVYKKDGKYYYVPGCGFDGMVAYKSCMTPTEQETGWTGKIWLYDSCWNNDYRNNTYPQFIMMRIYKTCLITDLNSSYYDETALYPIKWTTDASGACLIVLGPPLSAEESRMVGELLESEDAPDEGLNEVSPSRPAGQDESVAKDDSALSE